MPAAPLPQNELERLSALIDLSVLDTPAEPEFDALVQAAALMCGVPISLISLVDAERQWFKANIGFPGVTETPRDMGFCAHAIHDLGILEVQDATKDPRFADSPLVTADPKIRFYAGATLRLSNGANIGNLCVVDTQPHQLNESQRSALMLLAEVVVKALESRQALLLQHSTVKQVVALSEQVTLSEARYKALSDSSPLGVYATDAAGLCTYTNDRWQTIYGLTLEQSLGFGWKDGLHPDDVEKVFTTWSNNAPKGLEFSSTFRVKHASGSVRKVNSRAKPIKSAAGEITGWVGSVEDITQYQDALDQLSKSERRFRSIYESTPAMMHTINPQGYIINVSDLWLSTLGYTRNEVVGKRSAGFFTPASEEFAKNVALPRLFEQGRNDDIAYQMVTKAGVIIDVLLSAVLELDTEGQPLRALAVIRDVTMSKAAQRTSEALLSTLRTEFITSTIDCAGNFIEVNDAFCAISQYPANEVIGKNYRIVNSGYHPKAFFEAMWQTISSGNTWHGEICNRAKDGSHYWVDSVITPFKDANGNIERYISIRKDITQQVQQKGVIEAAKERMALATDSGEIGIWEYNIVDGSLIWDDWMYRLYGVARTDQVGTYDLWAKHLHPDDKAKAELTLTDAIEKNHPFNTEFRIIWQDGSTHYLRASAQVTHDSNGAPLKMVGVNWDVTQLRELAARLEEQHELLRVTLQSIGDAVITTDAEGHVMWLNPVAERMTGWASLEAKGRLLPQVFNIVNEETRLKTENPIATALVQGKVVGLANHTVLIAKDGDEYGIEDSAASIFNEKGELLGAVLVFHDVTEQRRLSGEVSYQAKHDNLTGLVNRSEFETCLRRLLHKTHEERSHHAVMYIDLDQFKIVNDTCGHSVGDQLLQQVSKILTNSIRTRDILARLGGDEFGVILEHCTVEQAQRVAEDICEKMENFRFLHEERRFRIGTSIGLVSVDNRWQTISAILQAADTACYAAKEAGRNRVHIWFDSDQAMRARHGEMQWATRIEQAIDENHFKLYAQRIENLTEENAGIHAEVLLRMMDSEGVMIPPSAFLPAAERFHLAARVDRWVLRNTIDWLLAFEDSTCIDMICINLSGQSIGDRTFHRQTVDMLTAAGSQICHLICLEITETAAVTNMADASLFIEQVNKLGVRVALDDFGAGASSFGYLKKLAVDILKIDGQFIKDLIDDPLDDAAVRCFIDVAKVVGLKTVAEFVDKPEVYARVKELGIDYAQGFLLHQPEPIDVALNVKEISHIRANSV